MSEGSSPASSSWSIYARVQFGHASQGEISCHWYCLNDQKKKDDSPSPLFVPEPEPDTHQFSKSAVLGSKLYIMGGMELPEYTYERAVRSSDVFHLDTHHHPGEGWKRGPSLLQARANPYVAVVNGKIYVLGGNFPDENPWGKVFYPVVNQWQPLNPSIQIPTSVSAHAVLEKDILLVHTPDTRQLFELNVGNGSCRVYNPPGKPFGIFLRGAVLLDGFLYFARYRLFAYDLEAKDWCNNTVEGLEDVFSPCLLPPTVYDMGNKRTGLVWARSDDGKLNLKLTTFGIKKQGGELVAHSLCHCNHLIEGTFMLDCLIVIEWKS